MVKDIGRLLAEEAEAAEGHRDDDVPLVRSRRPARRPPGPDPVRIPQRGDPRPLQPAILPLRP